VKHYRVMLTFAALVASPIWTSMSMAQDGGGITVSPAALSFSATAGSSTTLRNSLAVSAGSRTRFSVSASGQSGGRTWLSVSPSGTLTTPQTLTVLANPTGLTAAIYRGTISISSGERTQAVPVTLTITTSTRTLTVSPTALSFTATSGGSSPSAQSLSVSASPNSTFTASKSAAAWLTVAPTAGTTPATLTVSASVTGLAAGTYSGTITVSGNGLTRSVAVTFTVTSSGTPTLSVSPTALSFSATVGGTSPGAQTVSVSASPNTTFTASKSAAAWLTVAPGSGTTPASLSVTANATGLAAATYNGTITVSGNGLTRTVTVTFVVGTTTASGGPFKVIAWNDLGMHCDDGKDFSVAGFLPPFNTIHAHLVDTSGALVVSPSGYSLTYQAITDPLTNTINTTSIGKTNFWTYIASWGFGTQAPDVGLFGFAMPGTANTPQAMTFSTVDNSWMAQAIPLTNFADNGTNNYFPMMRVTAKNSTGAVLATTDIVLPISDEVGCGTCHASTSGYAAAMPSRGWVNNPDPAKDMKLNLLRKHDERFQTLALFQSAATQVGYNTAGLEATTVTKPVMCYACHGSAFVAITGISGVLPLTTALHGLHARVIDPATGATMDSGTTRSTCYTCHPGPKTQCLRGAMGTLLTSTGSHAIECQSCHGNLSALAVASRTGWFSEPNCANCHTGLASATNTTLAYTSAFTSGTTPRTPADLTFASNANSPTAGFSLFRTSSGHGGLQCEACHGSTHAEFPTPIVNDNVQSTNLQGHAGMLVECATCHATVPTTTNGGPHGMHPVGTTWVSRHQSVADSGGATACQGCHGTDYRGTILSKVQADRTLAGHTFTSGTIIGCYSCHNGPGGG